VRGKTFSDSGKVAKRKKNLTEKEERKLEKKGGKGEGKEETISCSGTALLIISTQCSEPFGRWNVQSPQEKKSLSEGEYFRQRKSEGEGESSETIPTSRN